MQQEEIKELEYSGLSSAEVKASRQMHGSNILTDKKLNALTQMLLELIREPMIVLLLIASVIYYVSGQPGDALFLAAAIILVGGISIFQNSRSTSALEKLKKITKAKTKVIRDDSIVHIDTEELVIGDVMIVDEGSIIPADGIILQSNDFSVDESLLTGESLSVYKSPDSDNNEVYHGTRINSGLAIARIIHIGDTTRLGKIGTRLDSIEKEKTPLQIQINNFVKKMVVWGIIIFILVWVINYYNSRELLDSLLKALTLAMSILPEEIPVAFATFMAMGTWRLMNQGIIVKQMQTVETLGSATVICVDKTGTITENKMEIVDIYTAQISGDSAESAERKDLIRMAMWASEPIPFDPMEIAIHAAYSKSTEADERPQFKMHHEYPLEGKPPMMTHIFEDQNKDRIIAAKGAPEAILAVCGLNSLQMSQHKLALDKLTSKGYRVLGVAAAQFAGNDFPDKQQSFEFDFLGFIAFFDPPKQNIRSVVQAFNNAGIKVKIITGDNESTTRAIADKIEFPGRDAIVNGEQWSTSESADISKLVHDNNIFTRMFPEAKLDIINALKAQHEIVAMTGDGVNDGPALKAAHIGIAMGHRGTEIAKNAASLILVEDDLSKMVDAIAMGRKIYTNLKKAIRYIISIHIPIILIVFIPLVLGWIYPNIFTPVHVILLELIMGPTCSIIYENEPMEKNTMDQPPRSFSANFFSKSELMHSIIQGLAIAVCSLLLYQLCVKQQCTEDIVRTMVFTSLMSANIFLTLVNRSFYYSFWSTLEYKNKLITLVISLSSILILVMIYLDPVTKFFRFDHLSLLQLLLSVAVGFLSVIWFEIVKWNRRQNMNIDATF